MSNQALNGLIFVKIAVPAYPLIGGLQEFQYYKYSGENLSLTLSAINLSSSIFVSWTQSMVGLAHSKNS